MPDSASYALLWHHHELVHMDVCVPMLSYALRTLLTQHWAIVLWSAAEMLNGLALKSGQRANLESTHDSRFKYMKEAQKVVAM